ncbi:phosphoribosylglycinamide formyltransferase [Paracoccaceae bacterium]|nr:phosphoribosylglycinamide formyltransferase [Paracoccaceae bacterium]
MTNLQKKKIAIFISGRGSNMIALINDMKNGKTHPGHPKLVISDNINADGLIFAKQHSVETFSLDIKKDEDKTVFEERTLSILKENKIDIICLAGFMRILSENFINTFSKPIMNIHPSLLPSFRGLNTHERVLEAGCLIHGATIHLITKKLDAGPILGQTVIKIPDDSTPHELRELLLPQEHLLYTKVLREFLKGSGKKILTTSF